MLEEGPRVDAVGSEQHAVRAGVGFGVHRLLTDETEHVLAQFRVPDEGERLAEGGEEAAFALGQQQVE